MCVYLQGPSRAILASSSLAEQTEVVTAIQAALVAAAADPEFVANVSNINEVPNFFLSNRTDRLTSFTPGIENFLDEGALAAYQGGRCTFYMYLSACSLTHPPTLTPTTHPPTDPHTAQLN